MNLPKISVLAILVLIFASNAFSQSIDGAVSKAKSEGKKVLVIFYSDNDSWSQKLQKEVLTYQEAVAELNNFVVLKINGDSGSKIEYGGKSYSIAELSSMFSVTGFPSFVFLTSDGAPISFKYNGETVKSLSGFLDAEDFVQMLKYFSSNKYTDTDLSTIFVN